MNANKDEAQVELKYLGEQRFLATTPRANSVLLDGTSKKAPSPMEGLLSSLGSCISADIVEILAKMRRPVRDMQLVTSGSRNSDYPRYFKSINLEFKITSNADLNQVERAIDLSLRKYCSVLHTLRADLKVTHTLELTPPGAGSGPGAPKA